MASYKNYEDPLKKYKNGIPNKYVKPRSFNKTNENKIKSTKLYDGFKKWISFYRANPHRFATEYLGFRLFTFQKIILFLMNRYDSFMSIAARGISKSWTISLFCCIRCILYPGTKIVVASGVKNQARLIITQKIDKDFRLNYPNLAREIKDVKTGANECLIIFHNGSVIEAVASRDSARGYRCNILILDEFRLIDSETLTKVLRPFLNVNRQPPYLNKPEYRHLQEENKEVYISSAYYKHHWCWDKFKSFANMMSKGKDYFVCGFNYYLSMHHNLLSEKRVEQMKQEDDYDDVSWSMEMDSLFFGQSDKAFFKLDEINKCRSIVKPMLPLNVLDYITASKKAKEGRKSKNKFHVPKQEGEVRIISMDVALMGKLFCPIM